MKWKKCSKVIYHAVGDRRRELGLGSYPGVTLSMARQKARKAHKLIEQGIGPVGRKKRPDRA